MDKPLDLPLSSYVEGNWPGLGAEVRVERCATEPRDGELLCDATVPEV